MKLRKGFVSNSSSSSFICDVSGEAGEIYDDDYADTGICGCKNGHTFQDRYYKGTTGLEDVIGTDSWGDNQTYRESVEPRDCPICNRTHITNHSLVDYLAENNIIDVKALKDSMQKEIKEAHPEWFI